nr:hypothetical protein [Sphaerisporangium cinnabarinum]
MGTTALVRDYRGTVLILGNLDLRAVLRVARGQGLPFLGNVDEHDDTVFNGHQLRLVADELEQITRTSPGLEPELQELTGMVELVDERPHRYLVFNGD